MTLSSEYILIVGVIVVFDRCFRRVYISIRVFRKKIPLLEIVSVQSFIQKVIFTAIPKACRLFLHLNRFNVAFNRVPVGPEMMFRTI